MTDLIESVLIKMVESLNALERLIIGSASPPPSSTAATASPASAATREQDESAFGMLTLDSMHLHSTPTTCEFNSNQRDGEQDHYHAHMTQLIAENAQLARTQEHLQQIIVGLSEYTLRLERNVELGDATATRLTHELHLHRHLASSAISMYHNAKHQLAAAELRQSVALDYIDELVVKYGPQTRYSFDEGGDDDTDNALRSPRSTVVACHDDDEVFELEEI